VTITIVVLALMPNLLEFFATGLALAGNAAVDIAVKAAVLFDAITDAPGAFRFAKMTIAYFAALLPESWAPALRVVEFVFGIPVLVLATIVIEVLFLSFALAA